MSEQLTNEQVRRWAGPNHEGPHHDLALELIALRAKNAELVAALEASLKYIVRYARCWKKDGVETPANDAALLVEEIDAALAAAGHTPT